MIIERIKFKAGGFPEANPLEIPTGTVTIFVGPNNGGKTTALDQVYSYCTGAGLDEENSVLEQIQYSAPDPEWSEKILDEIATLRKPKERLNNSDEQMVEIAGKRIKVNKFHLASGIRERHISRQNAYYFGRIWLHHYARSLNGIQRLKLADIQDQGDLTAPSKSFAKLYTSNAVRLRLWDTIFKAVGLHPFMHNTQGGKLGIVVSSEQPVANERNNDDDTIEHVKQSIPIENSSDGIRAFVGLLVETTAGEPKVICIDEPEAFLHPSLSETLGREVCSAAKTGNKQLFIATHSPHFLAGAVQSGADINIVRLTYDGGVPTASVLEESKLRDFIRVPKFRSVGMLPALFANHVIVTEGDSDKALYEELFVRLTVDNPSISAKNTIFLNARTKDQVKEIIEPLRALGIPTAGIVDLDVLKCKFTELIEKIGIPMERHQELSTSRTSSKEILTEKFGEKGKWHGGLFELNEQKREAVEPLLNSLAEYGLFVVPKGELEDWLAYLNVPKKPKERFVGEVFEKLGHDPQDSEYVKPSNGDVWQFLRRIETWLVNPNRKGMKR